MTSVNNLPDYAGSLALVQLHPPFGPHMTRHIALLRAINVSGRNVKMEVLRAVFVQLGFHAIDTYLASGNVLFDSNAHSPLLKTRIETALQRELGFEVLTFLRLQTELQDVAARITAIQARPGIVAANVAFFAQAPGAQAIRALKAFQTPIDDFEIHERELYWACAKKQSESNFDLGKLEGALKLPMTLRGANTVIQLASKAHPI